MAYLQAHLAMSPGEEELLDLLFDWLGALGGYADLPPPDQPQPEAEIWLVFFPLEGELALARELLGRKVASFNEAHGAGFAISSIDEVEERDWRTEWKEGFPPRPLGQKILVCPPWDIPKSEDGRKNIIIYPGQAFGTGLHETTQMAVELLEEHLPAGATILDMGCGSGILSLAARQLGAGEIAAIDLDADAIAEAEGNAQRSGIDGIRWVAGDAGKLQGERYGVVLANMLWQIIQTCFPALEEAVEPGGLALLGGITLAEEETAKAWLAARGWTIIDRRQAELFCALAVRRNHD